MKIINQFPTQRKTAVVTGASAGIGLETARLLYHEGYHIIAVGRNEKALSALAAELGKKRVSAVCADLCSTSECIRLYKFAVKYPVSVLINCAGMGVYGEFVSSSLRSEMDMLDINVRACHILTKLFLRQFICNNFGTIVNVSSAAGFMPGPFMSGYYAGKSYVINLSAAIHAELKRKRKNVHISVFCPGPVSTDFNTRMGIKGAFRGISPSEAARALVDGMNRNKFMIIPSLPMKILCALGGALPKEFISSVNCFIQKMKKKI